MQSTCASCLTAKANLECAGCHEPLCKTCAQFVDESSFAFYAEPPAGCEIGAYCPQCFSKQVAEPLAVYNDLLARAGQVFVYLPNQSKESRLLPRKEKKLTVTGIAGADEAMLRLAFQAVQKGFNCLVDCDITTTKIRDAGYQHVIFDGIAMPTHRPGRWKRM
jgi:hypothetical protein